MSRMLLVLGLVGCLPSPSEPPADPSVTLPGSNELAELLVEGLSTAQEGPWLDVQVDLSRPVQGVQLMFGVDGVDYPVEVAQGGGTASTTVRLALDPCTTFGRSVVVTAAVAGSAEIVAEMVPIAGTVAADGEEVVGLTGYCSTSPSFVVREPRDFWILSDGEVELESTAGSLAGGGSELSLHLERGAYQVFSSGSFVVVTAE